MQEDNNIANTSDFVEPTPEPADQIFIKAIGVGGGGNNAVNHMFRQNIRGVSFANINSDRKALRRSPVPVKLEIGDGLGAGNKPDKARQYAEEGMDRIQQLFDDNTKMVFITAGMGGGTGTGAGPIVAKLAKERGLLTIGIVTIPFLFEGQKKILKALEGADEMGKYVDALLVINNERLNEIYGDINFMNAFGKADDTLSNAARSISDIITSESMMECDFNDVETTLKDGGAAIISTGYGEGEGRVTKAIEDALNSPLLKNRDILGSKRLLFYLYINPNAEDEFLMSETDEITEFTRRINKDVDVIWGVGLDDTLGDTVKMTILAAGFDVTIRDEENDLELAHRGKKQSPRPGTRAEKTREPAGGERNVAGILAHEYGKDKAQELLGNKERSNYLILTPDELDSDEVCAFLESHPTYKREKRTIDELREHAPQPGNGGISHPFSGQGSTISF